VEIVGKLSFAERADLTTRYLVDPTSEAMPPEIRKVTRQAGAALIASRYGNKCSCGKPSIAIHQNHFVTKEGDEVIIAMTLLAMRGRNRTQIFFSRR
jgi:hypothetical protein